MRGAAGRIIGKSPSTTAAALLTLSSSTELVNPDAVDAAQAKEVLRVGPWSVRRAPGGPDAGLIYVNVETGRAQREPPQEVLDDLGMDEEGSAEEDPELAEQESAGLRASGSGSTWRGGGGSGGGSRPTSSGHRRSRPGSSGSRGARGAHNEASSGSARDSSSGFDAKFQRILLGNSRDVPLAMCRDILAALREDVELFDEVRRRFSDAPQEEKPVDLDGLTEELAAVAMALSPGEVSDVIGTEAGMQILLRVA